MAFTFSVQQIRLHAQVSIHSLHAPVLLFHRLHLADQRCIHPAILRPPFEKRRVAHPMLAAQLPHRHIAFGLPQGRDDLGLSVPA